MAGNKQNATAVVRYDKNSGELWPEGSETPISVPLTAAALATLMASLPTSLPGAPGVVWNNGGVLSIS